MESTYSLDSVSLRQRLERLEQAHRRLKRAVTAGLLGVAALGVMGQVFAQPKVVEAEKFIVRDQGIVRAELGSAYSATFLRLYDQAGKARIALSTLGDATSVTLEDAAGRSRVRLAVYPDGDAHLAVLDSAGKSRAVLGEIELQSAATDIREKRPASSLVPFNRDGKVTWKTP
jgi:hypothetical protein